MYFYTQLSSETGLTGRLSKMLKTECGCKWTGGVLGVAVPERDMDQVLSVRTVIVWFWTKILMRLHLHTAVFGSAHVKT